MGTVIKRDKFDFYGNTMFVQLIQDIYNGEQVTYSAIKFYNKQLNVMPIWHPWFGPTFMSVDRYTIAGIKPLYIPSELALEYGDKIALLVQKEYYDQLLSQTKFEVAQKPFLRDNTVTFESIQYGLYKSGKVLRYKINVDDYLIVYVAKKQRISGPDIKQYIPVNNIFADVKIYNGVPVDMIFIPKEIVPKDMKITAKNIYGLIAQQHKENYDKYVGSVFREVAEQAKTDVVRIPWVNIEYKPPIIIKQNIVNTPPKAVAIQEVQLTKYGIVTGLDR